MAAPSPDDPNALGSDGLPKIARTTTQTFGGKESTVAQVYNQPSPAQPSPAQPSPAQPSPAQPSPAQPSPAQPSPAQPSPAQPSPAQPSPAQPSPAQPSPAQPSPAQPNPAQPSPAQPSPAQPSPAQPWGIGHRQQGKVLSSLVFGSGCANRLRLRLRHYQPICRALLDTDSSDDERQRQQDDSDADADRLRGQNGDFLLYLQLYELEGRAGREWDVLPRSLDHYKTVTKAVDANGERLCGDSHYHTWYRMGRGTFDWLKRQLRPLIKTRRLSSDQRLAPTLWFLASGSSMLSVANELGMGHSTVHEAVHEVCAAIVTILSTKIRMPTTVDQLKASAAKFMAAGNGMPQCFAAVDGVHFAVKDWGVRAMVNRKGFTSYNVLALIDGDEQFINVEVGCPGSMHDARVMAESTAAGEGASAPTSASWAESL
ncbi:hypothetical protein QJQ45_010422 [Haematococcus lacustris]|nr:hypothetical protein QJQ45_010422 [Haematococcus lacustris]